MLPAPCRDSIPQKQKNPYNQIILVIMASVNNAQVGLLTELLSVIQKQIVGLLTGLPLVILKVLLVEGITMQRIVVQMLFITMHPPMLLKHILLLPHRIVHGSNSNNKVLLCHQQAVGWFLTCLYVCLGSEGQVARCRMERMRKT